MVQHPRNKTVRNHNRKHNGLPGEADAKADFSDGPESADIQALLAGPGGCHNRAETVEIQQVLQGSR